MKYLTLIYEQTGGLETLSPTQHESLVQQHVALAANTRQTGTYLGSVELKPPQTARSLRVEGGDTLISDGPFAEAKEYFIGYYLFDCTTLKDALDLAARIPTGPGGGMEIRPVDEGQECGGELPPRDPQSMQGRQVYTLLNYHPETLVENYSAQDLEALIASNVKMSETAFADDDYLGGYKLMPAATATALRGDNRQRDVIDGPFCEAKEVLLGFHLLACRSPQDAIDYAASLDVAGIGVVEVRPVNYYGPMDPGAAWNSPD